MPFILGLKFPRSKKFPSSPPQPEPTEPNHSSSGHGGEHLPVQKAADAKKLVTHHKLQLNEAGSEASIEKKALGLTRDKPKKKDRPSDQPVTRKNFSAAKNARPDETFTNNESLPGTELAYKQFIELYPEYRNTLTIDEIRAKEYAYLDESGHVCLDYSGYGLFSKWQETWHKPSASFGLSYVSVSLPTYALYGGADKGTAEYDIKRKVSKFLNIQETEYAMVFTASRVSAFKLLGESYPFNINKKLLSVYDYEGDAVKCLEEAAHRRGAEIMSAKFRWPSRRLWATDLKKKLVEKQRSKKEPGKGLFVFPVESRVTGAKYSYQWMLQAQGNGWDVLLDASALGPNVMSSLGLSVFRPDFIVGSFFKVYGSDPTGFGCLMIKQAVMQRLHSSSVAKGVGMVRLVSTSSLSEGEAKGGGLQGAETAPLGSLRFSQRMQATSATGLSEELSKALADPGPSNIFSRFSCKAAVIEDTKASPGMGYKHRQLLAKAVKANYNDDDDGDDGDDALAAMACSITRKEHKIVCRGLEHALELGLSRTNTRLRCLINWLVASMLKLRHPGAPDAHRLVQIYGPKVSYDRGASVAFNLFDWKGNLIQPSLVQRLADRSNISFGITTLNHVHLPKSTSSWPSYLDHLDSLSTSMRLTAEVRCAEKPSIIEVITISLCFLSNFQDVYRFWVFLANFLDADFVSKEVWLYRSLNQETVVLGFEDPSKSSF